jgi:carotenoid cleavage dioxygenase-like enzyme
MVSLWFVATMIEHDFMITKKYLVLLLPSFRFDKAKFMNKHSFLEAHYFDKDQATIVWLIDPIFQIEPS